MLTSNVMKKVSDVVMFSPPRSRFTSQAGLRIACTRWQRRGPARDGVQFINDGFAMYPFSGSEYPIGRQLQGIRTLVQRYRQLESALSLAIFAKEGGTMLNQLNCGQVRTNIPVWLSSVLHDQSSNREASWPR